MNRLLLTILWLREVIAVHERLIQLYLLVDELVAARRLRLIQMLTTLVQLLQGSHGAYIPRLSERPFYFLTMKAMSNAEFRATFRICRAVFDMVCRAIHDDEVFTRRQQLRESRSDLHLPVEFQVAVTVWRLGRPVSVRDVHNQFQLSIGSVSNCCRRVVTAILRRLSHVLSDAWPSDNIMLKRTAQAFEVFTDSILRNVVFSLDATLIPIWLLRGMHADHYFTRKGFYAIVAQIAVNASGFITWVRVGMHGTQWDGDGIVNTMFETLRDGLPLGMFGVADAGYRRHFKMVIPIKKPRNRELTEEERAFNYLVSQMRCVVEKVNGILKARWRWLLRGVQLKSLETYMRHFLVVCILHNLMMVDLRDRYIATVPELQILDKVWDCPDTGALDNDNVLRDVLHNVHIPMVFRSKMAKYAREQLQQIPRAVHTEDLNIDGDITDDSDTDSSDNDDHPEDGTGWGNIDDAADVDDPDLNDADNDHDTNDDAADSIFVALAEQAAASANPDHAFRDLLFQHLRDNGDLARTIKKLRRAEAQARYAASHQYRNHSGH
jgi:hypothetical protein